MFHFSKWIGTSPEEISAIGTSAEEIFAAGFTEGFSGQTQTPGFSQLRGLILPQGKHIPSKTGGLMPSKGIFMDLDSPSLGKISRGVQCGDSPNCTSF